LVAEGFGLGEKVAEFFFVEGFEDFKQLSEAVVGVVNGGEDLGVILGENAGPKAGVACGNAGGVAEAVAGTAERGGVSGEGREGGDGGHDVRQVGYAGDLVVVALWGHGRKNTAADDLPKGGKTLEISRRRVVRGGEDAGGVLTAEEIGAGGF
jgi:hypothetical protein